MRELRGRRTTEAGRPADGKPMGEESLEGFCCKLADPRVRRGSLPRGSDRPFKGSTSGPGSLAGRSRVPCESPQMATRACMLAAMMLLDKKAATGRRERSSGRVFGDRSEVLPAPRLGYEVNTAVDAQGLPGPDQGEARLASHPRRLQNLLRSSRAAHLQQHSLVVLQTGRPSALAARAVRNARARGATARGGQQLSLANAMPPTMFFSCV